MMSVSDDLNLVCIPKKLVKNYDSGTKFYSRVSIQTCDHRIHIYLYRIMGNCATLFPYIQNR